MNKKLKKGVFAAAAIGLIGISRIQAQTTNFMVSNFNTDQVTQASSWPFAGYPQGWGNWFGNDFVSATWDNTQDATVSNPTPGAMKVQINLSASDQYIVYDGFYTLNLDMVNSFTNLSFDIKFDPSSSVRTTGSGKDYGTLRVGAWDTGYVQDWFYTFSISATNSSGHPNTNWTHISIPINSSTVFGTYPNLTNITDVLIGMDGNNYGNSGYSGTQTYWIDNVQFIGPAKAANFVVANFNTNQVTQPSNWPFGGYPQGWGNWFGNDFVSATWDNTVDFTTGNPTPGSMKVNVNLSANDQYVLFDGFYTLSLAAPTVYTNLSFDIKFDASTSARNNGSTLDFGTMRVGTWDNYNQDWFYTFSIPATNGLGQPNTNWTVINIPLTQSLANSYPILSNITDVCIGIDGNSYGNSGYSGTQTYWIDNVVFSGPPPSTVPPPAPKLNIQPSAPALRIFAGSTVNWYDRAQIDATDHNQSWIWPGVSYPVTYSFTLKDFPVAPALQCQLDLIPTSSLPSGNNPTGNEYVDYNASNEVWMTINGLSANSDGSSGYYLLVGWKTNSPNTNPGNLALQNGGGVVNGIYTNTGNHSPVGTWTLTFTSATTGTVTPPGVSALPFTINDPNAATDFANPVLAVFGLQSYLNQPSGNTYPNEGTWVDYANISVTGVQDGGYSEDFTHETAGNTITSSGLWDISDSANSTSVLLVTSSTPLWINWSLPALGYSLAVSPNLPITAAPGYTYSGPDTVGSFVQPQQFNGYFGNPTAANEGGTNWVLYPASCLPTSVGSNAFFTLINPLPAN